VVIGGARLRLGDPDDIVTVITEAIHDRRLDILVRDEHDGFC
jgi:hypothetical protein